MADLSELLMAMLEEHWFWGGLTLAVLVWYATVTIYVAIKGVGDIRSMLRSLAGSREETNREP